MKTIDLYLLAKDFKNTDFVEGQCAIEKALMRQCGIKGLELLTYTEIHEVRYLHEPYMSVDFYGDQAKAMQATDENEVIRHIKLTRS